MIAGQAPEVTLLAILTLAGIIFLIAALSRKP